MWVFAVLLVEIDLEVTIIAVKRRKDRGLPKRIYAFIHPWGGIRIPYDYCVKQTVVNK